MTRRQPDFSDADIAVLARAVGIDGDVLRDELVRRPWYANDVLRRPEVVDAVVHGADTELLGVSPFLLFAVLVQGAAEEIAASDWVDEWVGRGCRLPVFDVEPLHEFADAPARLLFLARLLVDFAVPVATPALPIDSLDLDELVAWLDAVEEPDRAPLLRQLGDVALFRAGVFPDSTGATALAVDRAEHLGRSAHLSDDELDHLVDHGSSTPGLDALETLSAAWYRAAVESSPEMPVVMRDVAHRIRAARRFLNHVADRYLYRVQPGWAPGV